MSCSEKFGNTIDHFISNQFHKLGHAVGLRPKRTIIFAILLTAICGAGFSRFETEDRAEKLWVPQNTIAENEKDLNDKYFPTESRFNSIIIQANPESNNSDENALTKQVVMDAMKMHNKISTESVSVDDEDYDFQKLCSSAGGSCASSFTGICQCLLNSILRQWDYDINQLENDTDYMATINAYGTKEDLDAVLGDAVFDESDQLVSAKAFTISYFLKDRSKEQGENTSADPINEQWEKDVFLDTVENAAENYPSLHVEYISGRSFSDVFGGAISGDLLLVQISYAVVFIFLGATFGKFRPGPNSRWTMALSALILVVLSTGASFGVSAGVGLFFGPVHSLLPFILLGIGVDDAFVIVNAFNRERKGPRSSEDNADLAKRCAKAMARAGASITVTSMTDLVAFGISSSSNLPALASFCAYAAVGIVFLWGFAATFFSATLVLDERRQRDNRRECLCCITRKDSMKEEDELEFQEGIMSRIFRETYAPAILSKYGKIIVVVVFAGLFGFGVWGANNLAVEDTTRSFIPSDSYVASYINTVDNYFQTTGIDLYFIAEGNSKIYQSRVALADLDTRLSGLSTKAPYISEPNSEETYRNVLTGMSTYLNTTGSSALGGVALGSDNWPTTEDYFVAALKAYVSSSGPGALYARDVKFSEDGASIDAIRIESSYVALKKKKANGHIIDDADRQIKAMDTTRELVESWKNDVIVTPYSSEFISIEGFKIIKQELFMNVALSLIAVAVIVFFTVASPLTSLLITINVSFCIIEILGFMYVLGIAIDSVSVINIVLAVGLSIDYSAHVGHCFMVKGGDNKDRRALESLADIGAAVLNGAFTTFLAVVVLLFSSSYVFTTLSKQFALTVGLGVCHGLVLLPVLLSLVGPKAFEAAELPVGVSKVDKVVSEQNDLELAQERK
jgi:predicted RND superfamily exporter protein